MQSLRRKRVVLCAGHFIDPGSETGAPGERDMNMLIANAATSRLERRGWRVVRPELEEPTKSADWENYLEWLIRNSRNGVPVIEVHGQGVKAGMVRRGARGEVAGVQVQTPINPDKPRVLN